jgi:protein CpxP
MTLGTRTFSAIGAAVIVAGLGIATVSGQAGPARGPGGPGLRGGGPFPALRQLNLTDAQRDQIKTLIQEARGQNDQAPGARARELDELNRSLRAAIFADAPDQAQIDQLRTQIADAHSAALAARIELGQKIAQVLTPEQRKQARELPNRGPRGRAGMRHRGPGAIDRAR